MHVAEFTLHAKPGHFDGLELNSFNWHVQPLTVGKVESSFFEDQKLFPPGSVKFDCALLMRGVFEIAVQTFPQRCGSVAACEGKLLDECVCKCVDHYEPRIYVAH